MVVNIKPEQLDETIREQLETYSEEIRQNVNKNMKEVAEETAETLKKGGGYN